MYLVVEIKVPSAIDGGSGLGASIFCCVLTNKNMTAVDATSPHRMPSHVRLGNAPMHHKNGEMVIHRTIIERTLSTRRDVRTCVGVP